MKTKVLLISALPLVAALSIHADVLELKSGKTINGKYAGGTAGTIRFETGAGVQVVETSEALALTFTTAGVAAPAPAPQTAQPAAAPPAAAAPAASATSLSIPAGTTLLVRMVDPVSSKDAQGKRFTTTLESDLVVNSVTAAKAGTKIYGRIQSAQQARRYAGQSMLDLRLTEMAMGPNLVPIVTGGYAEAGSRSVQKTARSAGVGAAIGAIADGGEGAGKGAAIGAVASGLKRGETASVNPGELLEFRLQQPVTLNAAK